MPANHNSALFATTYSVVTLVWRASSHIMLVSDKAVTSLKSFHLIIVTTNMINLFTIGIVQNASKSTETILRICALCVENLTTREAAAVRTVKC